MSLRLGAILLFQSVRSSHFVMPSTGGDPSQCDNLNHSARTGYRHLRHHHFLQPVHHRLHHHRNWIWWHSQRHHRRWLWKHHHWHLQLWQALITIVRQHVPEHQMMLCCPIMKARIASIHGCNDTPDDDFEKHLAHDQIFCQMRFLADHSSVSETGAVTSTQLDLS